MNDSHIPYKNKTEFFGIPIISKGDRLSEKEEIKKFNIIENQLLAGSKGVMCCVFEEGSYSVIDNVDGTFTVMLLPTGQNVALEGIVRGGYCYTKNPIIWENLKNNSLYHLYINYTNKLYEDEKAFITSIKETTPWPKNLPNYLHLATVDLREDKPFINKNPDGKVYANDLASHSSDITNPHGRELFQDSLVVKRLVFEDNDKQVVLFDDNGNGVFNSLLNQESPEVDVSKIRKSKSYRDCNFLKQKSYEILSKGKEGVTIEVDGQCIDSVNISEKVSLNSDPTFKLGQTAVKYGKTNKVVIYNSGENGIPMIIVVNYR